jgi:hypothetical protein
MLHNTHFCQYVPPAAIHYATGTWTDAAGITADTICKSKAAGAETSIVTVPCQVPSNSIALQGVKISSIELDYECCGDPITSVTAVVHKIVRGAETVAATPSHPTITQSLIADSEANLTGPHRLVITLSSPAWIDNDEYYLCEFTVVTPGGVEFQVLGAFVNYTLRA